jgi:biopolymer transport protein ExbD
MKTALPIIIAVCADAKARYVPLRYILGQLQRAGISKVMLRLR